MSEPSPSNEDEQAERERRLNAIRTLADLTVPVERPQERPSLPVDEERAPEETSLGLAPRVSKADGFAALEDWSSPGRRIFWLATLAAVVVVFLLYGAIANGALRPGGARGLATTMSTPAAPGVLSIPLARDNLTCVSDLAWSPDSAQVAALGYSTPGQCAGIGSLNVYTASTGKVQATVTLDTVVLRALEAANSSNTLNPFIAYQQALWSANGSRLAVTLTIYTTLTAPNSNVPLAYGGLVLMDSSGGNIKVLLQPYAAANTVATRWDLTTGKATVLPARTVTIGGEALSFSTLPPALWYDWTPDDSLVVAIPLRTDAMPPSGPLTEATAPIGNPVSDAQFSVWQSGVASLQTTPLTGGDTILPGAYTWNTAFATWSPDGRDLVDPVELSARMQPTGAKAPDEQSLQRLGMAGSPLLPVRDAGLGAVLGGMQTNTYDPASQRVIVAWNSDAHLLAAYPSSFLTQAYSPGQIPRVTIYDTGSGHAVHQLPISSSTNPTAMRVDGAIRWSPDSRRLALYEPGLDSLLVWDTSSIAA